MAKAITSSRSTGMSLVIVESPAKAKTINKYLGDNFVVKASMGHVRDLPERDLGVDVENNFAPTYEVIGSRKTVISDLRKLVKGADAVYLATDLDREGEAIAWHLAEALHLSPATTKRVVFNEITKTAIQQAFATPRTLNLGKVNAQQARRILDRLVGYKVSPLLWKKVARGLSAGRVQSVAVKLVVERERAILAFIPEESWRLQGVFTTQLDQAGELAHQWQNFIAGDDEAEADDGTDSATVTAAPSGAQKRQWLQDNKAFRAQLVEVNGAKFDPRDVDTAKIAAELVGLAHAQVERIANTGKNGPRGVPAKGPAETLTQVIGTVDPRVANFTIRTLEQKESLSRPNAPFETSTLQQAASNQLGMGVSRTMRLAQQLYEGVDVQGVGTVGLITYMRTDSLNLSADAIAMARGYISGQFGAKYLPAKPNYYSSQEGAQEAHEAIRPTDVNLTPAVVRGSLTDEQYRVYELIWKRFVACQMTPAIFQVTEAIIDAMPVRNPKAKAVFKASGRTLVFDGYTRVAGIFLRPDEQILPALKPAQTVTPLDLTPTQHFTSPPGRYTEASLVKELKSEGIGRPSTYASIMETIQDRKYVDLRDRRMFATDLGIKVTDKLIEGFPDLMEVGFTRKIEGDLDQVETQGRVWTDVLREFYEPLMRDLETAESKMTHARLEAEPSEYKCAKCNAPMVYRLSKRGKRFLSCTRYPDCDGAMNVDREGKPVIPEVTDVKCPVCAAPMLKRIGRFGPFLGCSAYPTCKTILNLDRKTGQVLPPKPPAEKTGLDCPNCGKELLVRSSRRGPFISCSGYPKCRMALQHEQLETYKAAKVAGTWPTPDVLAKVTGKGKGKGKATAAAPAVAAEPAPKTKTKAAAKAPAKAKTTGRPKLKTPPAEA